MTAWLRLDPGILQIALGLVVFLSVSRVSVAQWVEFTPCGLKTPGETPHEVPKGPAPNIGPYWVWKPAVTGVLEIKEHPRAKVRCSLVFIPGRQLTVIGTGEEIINRLGNR